MYFKTFATLTAILLTFFSSERWTVVERSVVQDGGSWVLTYGFRNDGRSIVLFPQDVVASIQGLVSNSASEFHGVPRFSELKVDCRTNTITKDLVPSENESKTCKETLEFCLWLGDELPLRTFPGSARPTFDAPLLIIVPHGSTIHARIRIEHRHHLEGLEPLLGLRSVTIKEFGFRAEENLSHARKAFPTEAWPEAPEERRDMRQFVSAPDSLLLEAHVSGNNYYRFPERLVRRSERYRLSFSYLIAPHGEGEFRVRMSQYCDGAMGWRVLQEGAVEQTHSVVGRWTKVERIVRTEPEATSVALDFRIYGADIGEVWVDEVRLDPLHGSQKSP